MDLKKAFGDTYKSASSKKEPKKPEPEPQKTIETLQNIKNMIKTSGQETVTAPVAATRGGKLGSSYMENGGSSDMYLIQIQIGRDDCHLMCMFLLIFIISILMNRKN